MPDERSRRDAEILIHTAAPSRGQDDARYRAFARAFLDFESGRRINLADEYEGEQQAGLDEQASSQLQDELHLSTQERPGSESYRPESIEEDVESTQHSTQFSFERRDFEGQERDADGRGGSSFLHREVRRMNMALVVDSPQLSFNSIMDNADSPPLRISSRALPVTRLEKGSQVSEDFSWRPPPSVVEDSQPEIPRSKVQLSSPTRVLELYLQHFHTPEPSSSAPRRSGRIAARQATTCVTYSVDAMPMLHSSNEQSNIHSSPPVATQPSEGPWSLPISLPTSTDSIDVRSELPVMPELSPVLSSKLAPSPLRESSQNRSSSMSKATSSFDSELVPDSVRSASAPIIHPTGTPGLLARRSVQRIVPESPTLKRRDRNTHTTPHFSSSPELFGLPSELLNNQLANKRQCLSNAPEQGSRSPINHQKKDGPMKSTPPLLSGIDLSRYYLEIRPPAPSASTANLTPSSLITRSLEGLALRMRLPVLFKPKEQARPLRPFERGYWRVNWQLWTSELRERNWSCLSNYVGKGGAGWGVWCTRDEDFRMFRVYCWGEIVGHIYLLLYTSSESKIKGTGACWIDGSGEVIITMPS